MIFPSWTLFQSPDGRLKYSPLCRYYQVEAKITHMEYPEGEFVISTSRVLSAKRWQVLRLLTRVQEFPSFMPKRQGMPCPEPQPYQGRDCLEGGDGAHSDLLERRRDL